VLAAHWENTAEIVCAKAENETREQGLFQTKLRKQVERQMDSTCTPLKLACGAKNPEKTSQTSSLV
jgi:hypothetical protein